MPEKRKVQNSKKGSRGLTLVELIVATAVIAILAALVFQYFNRVSAGEYVRNKVQSFTGLLGVLENIRASNNGAYPAATTPIDLVLPSNVNHVGTSRLFAAYLGTDNSDYQGWTYTCNNNTLSIRISVTDTTNNNLREAVRTTIANNYVSQGWTCDTAVNNGIFTCTKAVVCR